MCRYLSSHEKEMTLKWLWASFANFLADDRRVQSLHERCRYDSSIKLLGIMYNDELVKLLFFRLLVKFKFISDHNNFIVAKLN